LDMLNEKMIMTGSNGVCGGAKIFWLHLTTASAQCLRLSKRFFHCKGKGRIIDMHVGGMELNLVMGSQLVAQLSLLSARLVDTFPVAKYHCHLAGIKLYCLCDRSNLGMNNLSRVATQSSAFTYYIEAGTRSAIWLHKFRTIYQKLRSSFYTSSNGSALAMHQQNPLIAHF